MVFVKRLAAGKRRGQATLRTFSPQKRKDLLHALAEHFFTAETRDAFHRAVPRGDAAFAIEREEAVNTRVEQTLQESWRFVRQAEIL